MRARRPGTWKASLGLVVLIGLLVSSCATIEVVPPPKIRFPSLAQAAPGESPTMLDGYLSRPADEARHPAVVLLHGCEGLLTADGRVQEREADWAARLTRLGYVVLMVDSFSPRKTGEMCSQKGFKAPVYLDRPKDAYGALRYLQEQPFVRPDRIGLMGWSQGGGVVLLTIAKEGLGRPAELPHGDFRAAVALYPTSCTEEVYQTPWTGVVPLLVLIGASDNWTPAEPCSQMLEDGRRRGATVDLQVYLGAYQGFDWPDLWIQALPAYRTGPGAIPIVGTDPDARTDALKRVPEFLGKYLME